MRTESVKALNVEELKCITFNGEDSSLKRRNSDAAECLQRMNRAYRGTHGTQSRKNVRTERAAGMERDFAAQFPFA